MVKDHSDSFHHMGYYFRLAARVLLYASSHRQDNTYHGIWYTSRGALAETKHKYMHNTVTFIRGTDCSMAKAGRYWVRISVPASNQSEFLRAQWIGVRLLHPLPFH